MYPGRGLPITFEALWYQSCQSEVGETFGVVCLSEPSAS